MNKVLCFCMIIIYSVLHLQATENRTSNYYFSHISGANGLSQSNVKAIFQDSYGFMWFGTKNGLNRFDGTSIVQKNCDDYIAGIGNHNISAIFEDKDKQLWIGTDRGVYCYNPASDVFTVMNRKTKEGVTMYNWVSHITQDSIGNIWIMIPDQGVFRYYNHKLYLYKVANEKSIKNTPLSCLSVFSDGEVWLGTWGTGLFRYNAKKDGFEPYRTHTEDSLLNGINITDICEYGDWMVISVHEGLVFKYNPTTKKCLKINLPEANDTFIRNVECFDGKLWIGTHSGLFIVDENKNKITHLHEDPICPFSLSDNIIYTIYRDRENGIWIGTTFGGVNYLPSNEFQFEKYIPDSDIHSLSSKRVREMVSDEKGNIWIGTEDGGINELNISTGKVSRIHYGKSVEKSRLATLSMFLFKNELFCGVFTQGIDVMSLSNHAIQSYSFKDLNLNEGSVYSFYIDRKGNKWIGTGQGLYTAKPGSFKFEKIKEVGYNWIFDIFEDNNGTLWFASMGSGLWKYHNHLFKKYNHDEREANTLSSNSVNSIMQDSKGRIWVSTDRGGICLYNAQTDDFVSFSVKDGFPDDVAYKILEDGHCNLWFGTNRGLVKFNPDTKKVRIFTTQNGLLGNQFNYKSALKGKDGKFYFGSIDGLIAFDPDSSEKRLPLPPVYISKMSIYNKEITVHTPNSPLTQSITHTEKVILSHNQANISFDLALPSYSTVATNQYYYRLLPLDKEWIKATNNMNISYAKLLPGDYVFEVKATNNIESEIYSTRSLSIVILPPWWLSVWAYMGYVAVLLCSVVFWFYWYKHRKEAQMEEKKKLFEIEKEKELYESKISFFTEIAHEVRTPLTLINGPLEAIYEMQLEDTKLNKNLSVIGQNTKRLLDLTAQLLDFQKIDSKKFRLKIESVDVTSLLNETIARFEPTIVQKRKILLQTIPQECIVAAIDKEAITKILSNLLNNALKYAAQYIRVELSNDETTFTVRVMSDGDKIAKEISHQIFEPFYQIEEKGNKANHAGGVGIGLPLARSLATFHNGDLYLDITQPQNTFVLTIPLHNSEIKEQIDTVVEQNIVALDETMSIETDNTRGYTLLLVEDNEDMSAFVADRLSNQFTVEIAYNGKEALDILRNNHIDLVISDIMMPVMNGYDMCKEIKSDLNLSHIPVIFLTAKNDLDSKITGLKLGAESYVEKPFSLNYLKTQILSLLNNRNKEREAFAKRPFFPVHNMQINKADEEFMDKVIKVIEDNITDDNFGVERMAEILCMSRSSLLRKIKTLFDLSPVDFIRLIRLKKAAELILDGKYRIGDIGYMVGINSPSYFTKAFLKQFGATPKEFEKQHLTAKGIGKDSLIKDL